MSKSSLSLLSLLLLAAPAVAHPGDGVFIDSKGDIYFTSTAPIVGRPGRHHAALWRFTKKGAVELVYKSEHRSSNLHSILGLDGRIYCQERHYLGEQEGRDVFETEVWRLEADGKRKVLLGPKRGRRPFGQAAFAVDETGALYYASGVVIKKLKPDGTETVFAGSTKGTWDASGSEAQFTNLQDFA